MDKIDIDLLEIDFNIIFKKFVDNPSPIDDQFCQSCLLTHPQNNWENSFQPFLQNIDRKILKFIYQTDTYIDNIQNRQEALEKLEQIRTNNSQNFSEINHILLQKIYDAEYHLIAKTILSNDEKLALRSKSWLFSAAACITSEGLNKFKDFYGDKWVETFIRGAFLIMIIDDYQDQDEDLKGDQPNIFLLSIRVFDLLTKDWISFMIRKHGMEIEHSIDANCFRSIISKSEMRKMAEKLFSILKEYVLRVG